MGVASPEMMAAVFSDRFNGRDAAGLRELYSPDAVFSMDGDGRVVGTDQIAAVLGGFLAAPLRFGGQYVSMYVCGDIALGRLKWQIHNDKEGTSTSGISAEVLYRGADGKWRYLISDATGGSRV
jgi:uncharacterized protein (TIGR02246 family)